MENLNALPWRMNRYSSSKGADGRTTAIVGNFVYERLHKEYGGTVMVANWNKCSPSEPQDVERLMECFAWKFLHRFTEVVIMIHRMYPLLARHIVFELQDYLAIQVEKVDPSRRNIQHLVTVETELPEELTMQLELAYSLVVIIFGCNDIQPYITTDVCKHIDGLMKKLEARNN